MHHFNVSAPLEGTFRDCKMEDFVETMRNTRSKLMKWSSTSENFKEQCILYNPLDCISLPPHNILWHKHDGYQRRWLGERAGIEYLAWGKRVEARMSVPRPLFVLRACTKSWVSAARSLYRSCWSPWVLQSCFRRGKKCQCDSRFDPRVLGLSLQRSSDSSHELLDRVHQAFRQGRCVKQLL